MIRTHPIADKVSGWFFKQDEVSNGVWVVEGKDLSGRSVSHTGTDPETLLDRCVSEAKEISAKIKNMERDQIRECGLTEDGVLYVKPASKKFPYIYREALGIQWDPKKEYLAFPSSVNPSKNDGFHFFSPSAAYAQILAAAREQGVELYPDQKTTWVNISEAEKLKIQESGHTCCFH